MKKLFCCLCVLSMLLSSAVGGALAENEKLSVVTTIFPIYDWVCQAAGDRAEVTMLLDDGVDLHSYQPTAPDMLKVLSCDLFIYVGGESDAWVDSVLNAAANPDLRAICLLEALGDDVKLEETVEGMEPEEEEEGDEEEGEEADEHIWLSLRNAQKLMRVIADALAEIDPDSAAVYQANAAVYIDQLSALDAEYAQTVQDAEYKTLLFGDRFPFRYLVDDYGLSYYAAFSGCSAETEASFQTVVFLAGKVDELDLPAVLTIEGTSHRIAETVVDNTRDRGAKVLTLNSMQSVTAEDMKAGAAYLKIMESNLQVLREALNK
ncbi:MAG: zinc ABC transporter substrate-binding protein [Clostridia bacterium]|nr:zinc ABC transporter substrate-binding protein [Clostridia bacterium]